MPDFLRGLEILQGTSFQIQTFFFFHSNMNLGDLYLYHQKLKYKLTFLLVPYLSSLVGSSLIFFFCLDIRLGLEVLIDVRANGLQVHLAGICIKFG